MGFLKTLPAALVLLASLLSCDVDLAGAAYSTDLDVRLQDKDVFNFHWLKEAKETPPILPAEYTFLVLSDTHVTGDKKGLEKLSGVVSANGDRFVVVTGDIPDPASRDYLQNFVDIFAPPATGGTFPVPCYPVIGNHDLFFGNYLAWRELIGSTCYSIDGGSARLVILDTGSAFFGGYQLDWLKSELDAAERRAQKVFIFTHSSLFLDPVINRDQLTDWTDLRERAKLMSLVKNRCEMVFTGHIHQRIEKTAAGVRFVALEDWKENRVYCRVHVSAAGVTYSFHTL